MGCDRQLVPPRRRFFFHACRLVLPQLARLRPFALPGRNRLWLFGLAPCCPSCSGLEAQVDCRNDCRTSCRKGSRAPACSQRLFPRLLIHHPPTTTTTILQPSHHHPPTTPSPPPPPPPPPPQ